MTIQTKHFIELSDILALRFVCKKCDTALSLSLADEKLRTDNSTNQFLAECPNCHEDWFSVAGNNYEPILRRATAALSRLKELLYSDSAAKLNVSLGWEIKADAVPDKRPKES